MELILKPSFEKLPPDFCVRLRTAREETGHSRRGFALAVNKSPDVWKTWENNVVPDVKGLNFLRGATGVDLNRFFGSSAGNGGGQRSGLEEGLIEEIAKQAQEVESQQRVRAVALAVQALFILPQKLREDFTTRVVCRTQGRSANGAFGELLAWDDEPGGVADFHERFRFFRRGCGLSQNKMAEYLEIRQSPVREWELRREANGRMFFLLAKFGVDLNWLVTGDGDWLKQGWLSSACAART